MKNLFLTFFYFLLLPVLIPSIVLAQKGQPVYSEILIDAKLRPELARLGVSADHGHTHGDKFETVVSEFELGILKEHKIPFEINVEDMYADYLRRMKEAENTVKPFSETCQNLTDTVTTPNDFELGSMGGYFTYSEMLEHLNNMRRKYPDLISEAQAVEGFSTIQGRDILWLRISDNPNTDEENETEVFYNSLTHAREPGSLSQNIFFMYYLLENYGKNQFVTHVVDNMELYFIPCINVDGYLFNEEIAPNGGGMWRKNRRLNADGTYGVDINRNYGYRWGGDGSSGESRSDVYRGTAPFSEPETRAVKSFIENHDFQYIFNHHTFSELLLYPFGFDLSTFAPDNELFMKHSAVMTRHNDYANIKASELYPADGTSDDWIYGELDIPAMTPEVGQAFWLTPDRIVPTCKETVWMNLSMALVADGYIDFRIHSPVEELFASEQQVEFSFSARGLKNDVPSNITVNLETTSPYVSAEGNFEMNDFTAFDRFRGNIAYTIDPNTPDGEVLNMVLVVNDGEKTFRYPFHKTYMSEGREQRLFFDSFEDLDNWSRIGAWGITQDEFYSEGGSLADSPNGNYMRGRTHYVRSKQPLDLSAFDKAYLRYKIKYEIDSNGRNDFFYVRAYNRDCDRRLLGSRMNYNNVYEPGYFGTQSEWIEETIDLSAFAGTDFRLEFSLQTGFALEADGIYLDDVEVFRVTNGDSGDDDVLSSDQPLWSDRISLFPNPSDGRTAKLGFSGMHGETFTIRLSDLSGRELQLLSFSPADSFQILELPVKKLNPGFYTVEVIKEGERHVKKLLVR